MSYGMVCSVRVAQAMAWYVAWVQHELWNDLWDDMTPII